MANSLTTCTICTDTKTPGDMFRSSACSHNSFCTTCISHHIKAKIGDNIANVECPEAGCKALLELNACASFVPKETLERWGDALCEGAIVGMQRLYCPFEDCSVTMIVEKGGKDEAVITKAQCMGCRRMLCVQCKAGWHVGMTCNAFRKRRDKEKKDLMAMNQVAERYGWKRCPNCQIYVSRVSGCDAMRCRCGCLFCYTCGAKWGFVHVCQTNFLCRWCCFQFHD